MLDDVPDLTDRLSAAQPLMRYDLAPDGAIRSVRGGSGSGSGSGMTMRPFEQPANGS